MSLTTARALWGSDVVRRALAEPMPDPPSRALANEVAQRADPARVSPHEFATWALALPWPRFCAVVRIVSGVTRSDLLGGET